VIATLKSTNGKTGNMVQIWIFYRHQKPTDAVKSGNDATVCFNCPLRGEKCYVNLAKAPNGIWKAYQRGNYPVLTSDRYPEIFGGRKVRFGAYGDPVLVPVEIVRAIVAIADGWTGYTHQWRKSEYQEFRQYLMASCDHTSDVALADSLGWRHFRTRLADGAILPGEIICPASDEGGKRTQCIRCLLCDGKKAMSDARKSIVIIVHGVGAKNFVPLMSIAPAA